MFLVSLSSSYLSLVLPRKVYGFSGSGLCQKWLSSNSIISSSSNKLHKYPSLPFTESNLLSLNFPLTTFIVILKKTEVIPADFLFVNFEDNNLYKLC